MHSIFNNLIFSNFEFKCSLHHVKFLICIIVMFLKEIASDPNNSEEVTITNVVTSATDDISKAELALVEDEIQKSCSRPQQYQKAVPEKIKKEVCKYFRDRVSS